MNREAAEKATRGVSPLLLVVAALAFLLLPVIGVSCNTSAAQPFVGSAISSLGGGNGGSGEQQAQQCLQELNNRDLVTYSGTNLAFGGTPHVDQGNTSACNSSSGSSSGINNNQPGIGIQPLFLAGFILIVATILLTALRGPLRNLLSAATAAVSFILLAVGASSVHTAIFDQINSSSGSNTLSSVGIGGTISSYFDVHPALGLWIAYIVLLLVIVLNALMAALTYASARAPAAGQPLPPPAAGQPLPPPAPPPAL